MADPIKWEPIEALPIFDKAAVTKPAPDELRFTPTNLAEVYRFVFANLGYSAEEVVEIGTDVLFNIPLLPTKKAWEIAAAVYFIGVLDGIRIQQAQDAIDRAPTEKGRLM
jgi:hypothetical protein